MSSFFTQKCPSGRGVFFFKFVEMCVVFKPVCYTLKRLHILMALRMEKKATFKNDYTVTV
jgi:hypothetical protein